MRYTCSMTELTPPTRQEVRRTDRYTGGYLLFVCVRCTLQYVVLPFVLPFVGVNNQIGVSLSLAIDVLALGLIVYNAHRLWRTSWRYRYLAMSVVMVGILLVFMYNDLHTLAGL